MRKIIAGSLVSTALLLTSITTALAATDVTIKDNGTDSTNKVDLVNKCDTTAVQTNKSATFVGIGVIQGTGNNTANSNTGGEVTVTSGDTASTITAVVKGDNNTLAPSDCCCALADEDTTVKIAGNGKDTKNSVSGKNKVTKTQVQKNKKLVGVVGGVLQGTGDNKAKNNTVKAGDKVEVESGETNSTIDVSVTGNSNL